MRQRKNLERIPPLDWRSIVDANLLAAEIADTVPVLLKPELVPETALIVALTMLLFCRPEAD